MKRQIIGTLIILIMSLLAVGSYSGSRPIKIVWEHEKQGFEHDDPDVVQECESSTIW